MHALAENFLEETLFIYWACIAVGGFAIETGFNGNRGHSFRGTLLNAASGFLVCVSSLVLGPLTMMCSYFLARRFGSGLITLNIFTEETVPAQIAAYCSTSLSRISFFTSGTVASIKLASSGTFTLSITVTRLSTSLLIFANIGSTVPCKAFLS